MEVQHNLTATLIPALFLVFDLTKPRIINVCSLVLFQAEPQPFKFFYCFLEIAVRIGLVLKIVEMLDIPNINLIPCVLLCVISLTDNPKQNIKDIILPPVQIISCLYNGLWAKCDFSAASFFLRFIL